MAVFSSLLFVLGLGTAACGAPESAPTGPDEPGDPGDPSDPGDPGDPGDPSDPGPGGDAFAALAALEPTCSSDGWCWRQPLPAGNDYAKVFATSSRNVWLIGQHGTVLQWNGVAWRVHAPAVSVGSPASTMAYAINGRGPNDMWLLIGATVQHWNGTEWTIRDTAPPNGVVSFNSIWAAPDGATWVTLSNGSVSRIVGNGVAQRIETGCACFLGSVWGTSSSDFWVTSLPGNILHYDGKAFTTSYSGNTPVGSFNGVSKDDVWVSGSDGMLLHWDGAAWTQVPTGLGRGFLGAVKALASNDVWWWAMSNSSASSAFMHWDGASLTTTRVDTTALGAFLYSATIIDGRWWMVGGAGAVYTKAGDGIQAIVNPQVMNLTSMWGTADDNMYFTTGGRVLRWDGRATKEFRPQVAASAIDGIRVDGRDELFGVGFEVSADRTSYHANAFHFDGTSWTRAQLATAPIAEHRYFTKVRALGPGEAIAVGYGGLAFRYADGAWTPIATNTTADLMGIWGPDADHLWIAGTNGTLLQWTRDQPDIAVAQLSLGTTEHLGAVHGTGRTVWVAAEGAVLRNTGDGWERIPTGMAVDGLFAIDDDNVVISSASQSLLARWNGSAFALEDNGSAMPTPVVFQPPGGKMLAGGLKSLVQRQ